MTYTIMNIEQAEALHVELLQNLPGPAGDARDALSEVVKLHAPKRGYGTDADCRACMGAQEEYLPWPCVEIAMINAWAHVDGIPAGAEAWREQ